MDQETNDLLREILRWLRFQSLDKAKAAVSGLLDSDKKKTVFEFTDGKASGRALAAKCGVDRNAISRWWNDWFTAGIITKEGDTFKRLFSLKELGFKLPGTISAKSHEEEKS
jgi:hypothetical protein